MARRNQGPRLKWHRYGAAYYICWSENGRSHERSTNTGNIQEAQAIFAEWLALRQKPTGPSSPAETLVTDILTDYALARGEKVIGRETLANNITALARLWEGKTVADVPSYVPTYLKKRNLSPGTMRRELGVLRTAINHAHTHGKLTQPVAVDLPQSPLPKNRFLTRMEAAALIRAAKLDPKARLYMPLFIFIGLYTGRRKEAILSLRWPQIDLDAKLIDFEIAGRSRTKKRRGRIPIPDRLLPHLIRARRRGSDLGPVLHINGKPIGNIKKGFTAACRRAGIDGVTPHTLKHTAITWACQSGVDLYQLSGFFAVTMKTLTETYAHHHPDYMKEAANSVGFRRISA
jgi:integrase